MLKIEKNKLRKTYSSVVYPETITRISEETGIAKDVVKKCLFVFKKDFKAYLKSKMERPLRIVGVFTIYKKQYKKTSEQFKNWRTQDEDIPFKKVK